MVSAEQALKIYDMQINGAALLEAAVSRVAQSIGLMTDALERTVNRMRELLEAGKKTETVARSLNGPVDSLVKSMATVGGGENGITNLRDQLNPANINQKNLLIPLAINVVWSLFGADILKLLEPAMVVLEAFAGVVRSALGTLSPIFMLLSWAAGGLAAALGWIGAQMDVIMPLVVGLAGALALLNGKTILVTVSTGIKTVLDNAHTAAVNLLTAAQQRLNAAMAANPLLAAATVLMVLIGVVYGAVAAFNKMTGSAVSATGIICGVFAVLGAFVLNNTVLPIQQGFAAFVNFLGNVFHNPVGAIKVLFYDMCLTVMGFVRNMAQGIESFINKIPGVSWNITSGLDSFYAELEQAQQAVKDETGWVEYVKKIDYIDYGDAARTGYDFGAKLQDKVGGLFSGAATQETEPPPLDELQSGVTQTAANTGKMAAEVNIADEDLQFLRDVAEMRYIQNFVTLSPSVAMNASISERVDVGTVVREIERQLEEEFSASAQGVFA